LDKIAFIGKNSINYRDHLSHEIIKKAINIHSIEKANPHLLADISVLVFFTENENIDHCELQKFKENNPQIPIILCVDENDNSCLRWAIRLRVWDVLFLPNEYSILNEKIQCIQRIRNLEYSGARRLYMPVKNCIDNENKASFEGITKKAMEFIAENYSRKIRVADMAAVCCLTTEQFARLFKKEYKYTPREYLKRFRIMMAKEMLIDTNTTVECIAFNVGFETVSLFNRLFKEIVGVPPSEFRRKVA